MICPRCKAKMTDQGRSYHKQRKWICPKCGRVRFQKLKPVPKDREGKTKK
jgi:transposase-like protein